MLKTKLSSVLLRPLFVLLVFTAIGVAFGVSSAAIFENIRFGDGVRQIVHAVDLLRVLPAAPTAPNLDAWEILERANQIDGAGRINPWQGDIKMTTLNPPTIVQVDSLMPTHVCRRMARYMLDNMSTPAFYLGAVLARSVDADWTRLSPTDSTENDIGTACGKQKYAYLGLQFRIK